MARTVFSPRWLLAIVVAAAFGVACLYLGRWQWGKYEDKQLRADTVRTHYGAPPVPITGVLGSLPPGETGEWTRVTARGTYDDTHRLLVRNRVQGGSPGLEVLVPFTLVGDPPTGGARPADVPSRGGTRQVLVDRGWVQNADTAAAQPTVPGAPAGVVTVQGWLRRPEPSLGRDLPQGQLASIAVADAEQQTGLSLLPAYLVMESERTSSGVTPARPAALDPPDTDLGPNQAYAFQWWLFSVFGFVFYGYRLRVTRAEQRSPLDDGAAATTGPGEPARGRDGSATEAPGPQLEPVGAGKRGRPRKVRIWDEEDG